jgi:hypothetical protein
VMVLRKCFAVAPIILAPVLALQAACAQAPSLTVWLPSWPLQNVGDPIPSATIESWRSKPIAETCASLRGKYAEFPSKHNRPVPKPNDATYPEYRLNPGDICDDGDMTLFNGLLCASGEEIGCRAVAASQADSGRWYRSPHRLWEWSARCPVFKADSKDSLQAQKFDDDCSGSFSHDMAMGVMLFVLHERQNIPRYRKWLGWLAQNADTSKLCKLLSETRPAETSDCVAITWPRYCTDDLGWDTDPGPAIAGRHGGKCSLLPPEDLDFSALDDATSTTPPTNIASYELESRAIVKAGVSSLTGGTLSQVPPLAILSSTEATNFPAHVDAARILMRMMILNPSLKLDNLPEIPDPSEFILNELGPLANDGVDPLTIHASAVAIASRAAWNPYYQLLAQGPTNRVRDMILSACPAAGGQHLGRNWIWEKDSSLNSIDHVPENDKSESMGWDCVFVGNLFNKMRVRKDLAVELLDKFVGYVDKTDVTLNIAKKALEFDEAANLAEEHLLDQAKQELHDAQKFEQDYANARDALVKEQKSLTGQLDSLNSQAANIQKQGIDLAAEAAKLPANIQDQVTQQACDAAGRILGRAAKNLCHNVTTSVSVPNKIKEDMIGRAQGLSKQAVDLQKGAIHDTSNHLNNVVAQLAVLDKKYTETMIALQNNSLLAVVNAEEDRIKLMNTEVVGAKEAVTQAQAFHDKLVSFVEVWKNGDK